MSLFKDIDGKVSSKRVVTLVLLLATLWVGYVLLYTTLPLNYTHEILIQYNAMLTTKLAIFKGLLTLLGTSTTTLVAERFKRN